jgi:acyl-CoA thioester hydrolase
MARHKLSLLLGVLLSHTTAALTSPSLAKHGIMATPTTPLQMPMRVYIEDTDMQGIVFYANYLKYFERAAMASLGTSTVSKLQRSSEPFIFGLQSAHGLRYSVPATLGDECDVHLEPLGVDAKKQHFAARAALVRRADGKELMSAADLRFGFVSVRSLELAPWPLPTESSDAIAPEDPAAVDSDDAVPVAGSSPRLPVSDGPLTLQVDECSASGGLSLHSAARFFERHRTTFLGGPDQLGAFSEAGVNIVVGRINNLRLMAPAAGSVGIGSELELRCRVLLRARGTQVIFQQWLLDAENGSALARADVTCICLDAESGRFKPLPSTLLARLEEWQRLGTYSHTLN